MATVCKLVEIVVPIVLLEKAIKFGRGPFLGTGNVQCDWKDRTLDCHSQKIESRFGIGGRLFSCQGRNAWL